MPNNNIRRVLIVSSDRTDLTGAPSNLGDAFLTDAFATALERAGHEPVVVDFGDPRATGGRPRLTLSGLSALVRAIRESDAVVIGGGTMLQDDSPDSVFGGLPRLCLVTSMVARVLRRPVALFGVGCDPISRYIPRKMVQMATAKVAIWVREGDSATRFKDMFGSEAGVAADVALFDQPYPPRSARRYGVTLALNASEVPEITEAVLAGLLRRGSVRFVAMDQRLIHGDQARLKPEIAKQLGYEFSPGDWQSAWTDIEASGILVASRMHALYMGALLGVPMVALGSRPKVVSFANEFGIPRVESLAHFDPQLARSANVDAVSAARERLDHAFRELCVSVLDSNAVPA